MQLFAEVVAALSTTGVRFVVMGVWGANYYATGPLFVTQDQDLFLPADPANLLRAWAACEQSGLALLSLFLATHAAGLRRLLGRSSGTP